MSDRTEYGPIFLNILGEKISISATVLLSISLHRRTQSYFSQKGTTEATILISPIDFEKYDIGEGLLHNETKNFMEWNYIEWTFIDILS